MDRIWRGIVSGFGATVVISIFMFVKAWAPIAPEADYIGALVKVSTIRLGWPLEPWVGWVEHFLVGTFLWGIAYAVLEPVLPGPGWLRGLLFALGAWILMMVLLLPPAGLGWFGAQLGYAAPVSALVLHIVYGLCLGSLFAVLQYESRLPARTRRSF